MDHLEQLDHPEQSSAIDEALASLDTEDLAAKSNALTGGCLRGIDALKVARLVAFSAARNPGRRVVVAGVSGEMAGGRISLGFSGPLCDIQLPTPRL